MGKKKIGTGLFVIAFIIIIGIIGMQFMNPTIGNVFTEIGNTLIDAPEGSVNTNSEEYEQEDIAQVDTGHDATVVEPQERLVIMNGNMTVEAYDPTEIVDFVHNLTKRYHGYVIESTLENQYFKDDTSRAVGYVKIRIPANRLFDAIEEIEAQNLEVTYKLVEGDDVTSEYVDLKSRLRNLEEAAVQIQAIMDTTQDVESVLRVYGELDKINEEAEVIRGKIQYYEQASAMSSLAVTVNPIIEVPEPTPTTEPTPTPTPEPWSLGPTYEYASKELTNIFHDWLQGWVYFLIYLLPAFLLRAGPWLIGAFFVGRWAYKKYVIPKIESNKPE